MSLETNTQLAPQRLTKNWTALPAWSPIPGLGALTINAFLHKGAEPMLVDTGLESLSDDFIARLSAEVDLEDLRWIWLSHTDADHIGNLDRILALAPNAQVVTNFLGMAKLGLLKKGDFSRLRLLEPGEVLDVGGRRLHQVKPPYYDAPETMGFFDEAERVLFIADAFGALLPEVVGSVEDVTDTDLRDGMVTWSSIDAPWLANLDAGKLGAILKDLEAMAPEHVLSGHLPPSARLPALTGVIRNAYGRGTTDNLGEDAAGRFEAALV